ncbi:hypothetical protein Glove_372g161 [Diversispora epigaea]|uniref:Uncharacterized protein n=1 Tax=Diversispora epigaea TaxID=1348612 RepID=A0A397H7F6_9GLOM|nr:hypothetical protein Glove_372g161 [Diversispora epigaea]
MEENYILFDEEREGLIEEWPIQNIAKFGRNLVVSDIRYYLEFQEYPNLSETGFASVYNVSGWDENNVKEAFFMKNIQYSYGGNGTIRTIKNCEFFPGIKVSKEQRECLGIKVCEFASKELNAEHISCTGQPKLGEFTQIIDSIPSKRKFIGCINWRLEELDHRYIIIPDNIDLELLETMFNKYSYHARGIDFEKDESNVINECFMVHPNSTRSDTCPFLYKIGNRIVKEIINKKAQPCPVKFYHIIPENLKDYPFIVTISVGIHPPPPPRKTLYNIKNQLQKIIDNEHILDLIARKLLTRSIIKTYLNGKQISDLHPSLNNQSKISYYIEKTRRSQYPFGQNILGVAYEFMKHEMSTDPYIRSIRFLDNGQYVVLCATKQQLKAIKELTYIEIDMAFKRIHGKTNEWEVSAYLYHTQKTLTFVRIFTNIETAEVYKNLFEDLFTCIEKDTGETFNFYHIHGKELGCILVDQHKGQALGLGQYLHSKYPIFSPIEHLQHNIQFCDEPGTEDWVKDKLIPWVLSGISVAFTKMDHVIWNQTPNNTNVGESAHANVNHNKKRRKGKQPVLSSSSNKTKKQKNNSNENDENLQINQQQNLNRVAIEKLNIQKQMNDELEREITLLEKRKQLMN